MKLFDVDQPVDPVVAFTFAADHVGNGNFAVTAEVDLVVGPIAFEDGGVDSATTDQVVIARATRQGVIAGSAVQPVVAVAAVQDVVALGAEGDVGTGCSGESIGGLIAEEIGDTQEIVTGDDVGLAAGSGSRRVGNGVADDDVVETITVDVAATADRNTEEVVVAFRFEHHAGRTVER